jgi:hypothetical protein
MLNDENSQKRVGHLAVANGFGPNATYQFYRTERWLGRLEAIGAGRYKPVGSFDDPFDVVLAFFLHCHHVKDWLMTGPEWQDGVDPKVKNRAVEQFIEESDALRACADLCNGVKHFQLDNKPRSGFAPEFHSRHVKIDLTGDLPITRIQYVLRTKRDNTDAYALAKECLECWRTFIHESTPESLRDLADRHRNSRSKGQSDAFSCGTSKSVR